MALKQITSVGLRKEHYKADALILYCVDHRGNEALDEFIRAKGFKYYDLIQIPGGAKSLVVLSRDIIGRGSIWSYIVRLVGRKMILGWISMLIRLHHAERIILTTHIDCGAFGGSSSFLIQGMERRILEDWLVEAKNFLAKKLPGVAIEMYLVDHDGFQQVVDNSYDGCACAPH